MRLSVVLALCALLPSPTSAAPKRTARATPAPDTARAFAERVADRYRGLSRFSLRGSSHVEVNGATYQNAFDVPFHFAGDRPGRFRTEVLNPYRSTLVVSDGDSMVTYVPQFMQYMVQSGAEARDPARLAVPDFARTVQPLLDYERLLERGRGVRVLGPDTVRLTDRIADCTRLEVDLRPDSTRANMSEWPRVYWIDSQTGLSVKDSLRSDILHPQLGQVTTLQITRFTSVELDRSPHDTTFRFQPPGSAVRVAALGAPGATPPPDPSRRLIGKAAPDFTLTGLDGKSVQLSKLKGQVVLLDFWATWCGPCRRWMPIVEKVTGELKPKGLRTYAVNLREPVEKIRTYLERQKVHVAVLLDRDGRVGGEYAADSIPLTVVVGRDGKVVETLLGLHDESALRAALTRAGL